MQLARLIGLPLFLERFGWPQTAEPEARGLAVLVGARLEEIASGLVEEAAASDDVIDVPSAQAFLDDRLTTFGELITQPHREELARMFRERTKDW